MASDSIAEQIVTTILDALEGVSSISTVERNFPTLEEIERAAVTQLPKVCVVPDLPQTVNWGSSVNHYNDRVQSEIPISLFLYFQARVEPSETAFSLVDDLWAALLSDATWGGLAMQTEIYPEALGYFGAIVACRLDLRVRYLHNGSSI